MTGVDFFQLTDVGCVREQNQDAVGSWAYEDGVVLAVAGGIGTAAGAEASALALETIARETGRAPGGWDIQKALKRAVQEANLAIYQRAITVPELRGMATTLTASAIVGGTLVAAHVGNCRLLLLRDGVVTQLTKDHTWVAEQLEYGLLAPEEAATHPRRAVVTRCLGRELIVAIDMLQLDLRARDVIVQCSDGLHGLVAEDEIAELLLAHPPEAACRALVRRGCEEGGDDNLSVQVAAITDVPVAARSWWRLGR
jgi:protein phosphatase